MYSLVIRKKDVSFSVPYQQRTVMATNILFCSL
jgi:hypothetical protein